MVKWGSLYNTASEIFENHTNFSSSRSHDPSTIYYLLMVAKQSVITEVSFRVELQLAILLLLPRKIGGGGIPRYLTSCPERGLHGTLGALYPLLVNAI